MPEHGWLRPASRPELVAVLADAICMSAGGSMPRSAEMFLAGVSAEHLADRLALSGFTVMRPARPGDPPRQGLLWEQGRLTRIVTGARVGQYVLLVDTDGLRHAVRLGSILAASDTDEGQDLTVLQLPGGRSVLVQTSLETVLGWLG